MAVDLAKTIPIPTCSVDNLLANQPRPEVWFEYKPVSEFDTYNVIKNLKPKTSLGPHNLSNKLVKNLKEVISKPLTTITNKSFQENKFPEYIKTAKLRPLLKNDDDDFDTSNYRPISNVPIFSKVIEKASQNQEKTHLQNNNIITDHQFGFRPNHSTVHPLMLTKAYIEKHTNAGKFVILISIDLKKAFDTIDVQSILPKKLEHYKFSENSKKFYQSYFLNRSQTVIANDTFSTTENLKNISVVQGSSKGPSAFLKIINDIVTNTNFYTCLFADDTNLLCNSSNFDELENFANVELIKIKNFMDANRLSLNLKKTVFTYFKPKKGPHKNDKREFKLKIGNEEIKFVKELRFLGLIIDNELKFKTHVQNVVKKMKRGLGALSLIKHTFPIKTKLLIYNALIKPHYEYVSIIWSTNISKKQTNEIIKLQKRALRLIYLKNSIHHTSDLFKQSGVIRFDFLFEKEMLDLMYKKQTMQIPNLINKQLSNLSHSLNTRLANSVNYSLPSNVFNGNLMFNLLDSWNKSPKYIKNKILSATKPPNNNIRNLNEKFKKIIKDYINTKYKQCSVKNCTSCEFSTYGTKKIKGVIIPYFS